MKHHSPQVSAIPFDEAISMLDTMEIEHRLDQGIYDIYRLRGGGRAVCLIIGEEKCATIEYPS